jgi:riboflavin kinase/FMN adenylyltransferase|tara:strand:+ start:3337 stop:4293 length:957 start_codon:yes stop_codon:yes gene_type:complete
MEIIRSIEEFGLKNKNQSIVLAIGMFDGVHLGHQQVLAATCQSSFQISGLAAAFTFPKHPASYLRPGKEPPLLMDASQKAEKLLDCGMKAVVMREFNREFSSVEAEDFVPFLKDRIPSLHGICVGKNFRFGKDRIGDSEFLKLKSEEIGINVEVIDSKVLDGEAISSSRIRIALASGGIELVNEMLGRPYSVHGIVQPGKAMGRKIGFPTLNLDWEPQCRPVYGVYAGFLTRESSAKRLPAVANYGLRPTVENQALLPRLEIHSIEELDHMEWKTGIFLKMELCHFIRAEKKFDSLDDLKFQISKDKEQARELLDKLS